MDKYSAREVFSVEQAAELAPCPFCGHDKPHFERTGTNRHSCIVECGMCGCRHESSDEYERSGESWNTRVDLSRQAAPGVAGEAGGSPFGRDADWALAMAEALGTNSGYQVPIVPDPAAFRELFAAVRASQPHPTGDTQPAMKPTYYVAHPDGTFSVADPQPGDTQQEAVGEVTGEGNNFSYVLFKRLPKGTKLFTHPPEAIALAQEVRDKAVEICEGNKVVNGRYLAAMIAAIPIPAEANAALEKICTEVAKAVFDECQKPGRSWEKLRAIVTSVIEKGE